jgi:hypothetical protein
VPDGSGGKFEHGDFVEGDEDGDAEGEAVAGEGGPGAEAAAAEAEADEDAVWTPLRWKRGHLVVVTVLEVAFVVLITEFSYSRYFSANQYAFIVCFKLAQIFLDLGLRSVLRDVLLVSPLLVMLQVLQIFVIQGADTFTDFLIAYGATLAIVVTSRVYVEPAVKAMHSRLPKYLLLLKRRFRKNRRLTREQRLAEEADWKRINEEIALETEGVEPLLESYLLYSSETAALFAQPFVQLLIFLLDASPLHRFNVTRIPAQYGIRETDLVYYTMFFLVIIPAQLALDMFLLNTQELAHGWKLYDYVSYQRYRFTQRETRWQLDSHSVDASISEHLQSADLMCFSSQYYFLLSMHAWGMILAALGIIIQLRWQYNMFGDWVLIVILAGCWGLLAVMRHVLRALGNAAALWQRRTLEGTVEDEVAAKLAIGEGTAADLEAERLEMAAMNSERFRQRFLERNRPWLIAHLMELLTPRTLQLQGADGRPHVQYIREVYEQLQGMGAGLGGGGGGAGKGGRDDISDDSGDDGLTAEQRRAWAEMPIPRIGRAVAQWWLDKARRRMMYRKLVTGVMENNRRPTCDACGRSEHATNLVRVELASCGEWDPQALDRLIAEFERAQGGDDAALDFTAWKAYFRAHAQFFMRCDACASRAGEALERARQEEKFGAAARAAAEARAQAARVAAAAQLEEDAANDVPWDAVTVPHNSALGRIMSKWLAAARTREGGQFPRPDARTEVEAYMRRMRESKAARIRRQLEARKRAEQGEAGDGAQDGKGARDGDGEEARRFGAVAVTPSTRAIALTWMLESRVSASQREAVAAAELRAQLADAVAALQPADDWLYTAETRVRGAGLAADAARVDARRAEVGDELAGALEAEAAALDAYIVQRSAERAALLAKLAADMAAAGAAGGHDVLVRQAALRAAADAAVADLDGRVAEKRESAMREFVRLRSAALRRLETAEAPLRAAALEWLAVVKRKRDKAAAAAANAAQAATAQASAAGGRRAARRKSED